MLKNVSICKAGASLATYVTIAQARVTWQHKKRYLGQAQTFIDFEWISGCHFEYCFVDENEFHLFFRACSHATFVTILMIESGHPGLHKCCKNALFMEVGVLRSSFFIVCAFKPSWGSVMAPQNKDIQRSVVEKQLWIRITNNQLGAAQTHDSGIAAQLRSLAEARKEGPADDGNRSSDRTFQFHAIALNKWGRREDRMQSSLIGTQADYGKRWISAGRFYLHAEALYVYHTRAVMEKSQRYQRSKVWEGDPGSSDEILHEGIPC